MTKRIVYIATDSGIDGREPERVLYAAWTEQERDEMLQADKSKAWRRPTEKIIDEDVAKRQALAKLDGIDRLVLDLPAWPNVQGEARPHEQPKRKDHE